MKRFNKIIQFYQTHFYSGNNFFYSYQTYSYTQKFFLGTETKKKNISNEKLFIEIKLLANMP